MNSFASGAACSREKDADTPVMSFGRSAVGSELLLTNAETICAVSSASFVSVSLSVTVLSDMYFPIAQSS